VCYIEGILFSLLLFVFPQYQIVIAIFVEYLSHKDNLVPHFMDIDYLLIIHLSVRVVIVKYLIKMYMLRDRETILGCSGGLVSYFADGC
jgi:hypothetical protein